jgi:hypothetical protein
MIWFCCGPSSAGWARSPAWWSCHLLWLSCQGRGAELSWEWKGQWNRLFLWFLWTARSIDLQWTAYCGLGNLQPLFEGAWQRLIFCIGTASHDPGNIAFCTFFGGFDWICISQKILGHWLWLPIWGWTRMDLGHWRCISSGSMSGLRGYWKSNSACVASPLTT